MIEFTEHQYDQAIENLKLAKKAISEPGPGCHVCGGDCLPHQCGHNPLYAMRMCEKIVQDSCELHHTLHVLAGANTYMGEPVGPVRICVPPADKEKGDE